MYVYVEGVYVYVHVHVHVYVYMYVYVYVYVHVYVYMHVCVYVRVCVSDPRLISASISGIYHAQHLGNKSLPTTVTQAEGMSTYARC